MLYFRTGEKHRVNGFTIEYVELPNGRIPAREFIDSQDDKAVKLDPSFFDRELCGSSEGSQMENSVRQLNFHL